MQQDLDIELSYDESMFLLLAMVARHSKSLSSLKHNCHVVQYDNMIKIIVLSQICNGHQLVWYNILWTVTAAEITDVNVPMQMRIKKSRLFLCKKIKWASEAGVNKGKDNLKGKHRSADFFNRKRVSFFFKCDELQKLYDTDKIAS